MTNRPHSTDCQSENRWGLAHFAMPRQQNVPVPFSANGSLIGSYDPRARIRGGLLIALFVAPAWLAGSATPGQGVDTPPQTVQMVVDYGDGVELRFTSIAWRKGLTALEALDSAATHPHGVKYKARGAGAHAFVTQIGDLKNEGGGVKSRNWIFKVDGKESDVGVGARELKAGEAVLWKFEVADYNR